MATPVLDIKWSWPEIPHHFPHLLPLLLSSTMWTTDKARQETLSIWVKMLILMFLILCLYFQGWSGLCAGLLTCLTGYVIDRDIGKLRKCRPSVCRPEVLGESPSPLNPVRAVTMALEILSLRIRFYPFRIPKFWLKPAINIEKSNIKWIKDTIVVF